MNEHENSGPKHTQIDISNDENLAYWMQLLNCDKEVLLLAIRMVGNNVTKVDAYLSMNRLKNND
jgi:hypothetical protein